MAKRTSKKKIQLADSKLLPLLAISALVLLVFFVSRSPNLLNKFTRKTGPAPTQPEFPIDTENDGVYTNYKYGFKFEYPSDKFNLEYSLVDWASWIYLEEKSNTFIKLGVYVYEGKEYESKKAIYDIKQQKPGTTINILTEIKDDNFKATTVYSKSPPNLAMDGNSAYSEYWWFDDIQRVIVLNFFSGVEFDKFIKENKNLFDEIVGSFELI